MQIEQEVETTRLELEEDLRRVQTKLEVKSEVLEYAKTKAAHYITLVERLNLETRELKLDQIDLEKKLRRLNFHQVRDDE